MDEIIEDLIDKMNKTSYDDTVILGTLLILLESNKEAYKTVFKEGGEKKEITEDTNIFIDVASDILNKTHVEQKFEFKDFKANYNNLPQITDIMNNSDDPEKTQTNFEQNFVNLAQVFYEMQFCGDKLVTSDTNIQNIMVIVENMLLTKPKSLQVTYYNNKRLLNDDRIKQEEFANIANVDFGRAATLKDLKKRVSVPTDSTIKHQIVVLDDPEIGVDKIKELVDLCNIYTVFILVNIPGFEHEKEIVRIVSITFSTAPPKEQSSPDPQVQKLVELIEGGAKNLLCSPVKNEITKKNLAIGRHIKNSSLNFLSTDLKKSPALVKNCVKELNYTVIDKETEKEFKDVLERLTSLFKEKPDSINLITYDDYQELVKTLEDAKLGGKTKLDKCLNKLGYKFQETKPDTTGPALVATPPDVSVDDYCNEVKKKIENNDYTYSDFLKESPDEEKLNKCLQDQDYLSEDCLKVLQQIRENDYAFGNYIMQNSYDELLKITDQNDLNKCLNALGFELAKEECEMIIPSLKQIINTYSITDNTLTLEQFDELLKLLYPNKTPLEDEKNQVERCLTSLDYRIKESKLETEKSSNGPIGTDSSTDAPSTGSASTGSTDAASTVSPSIGSTDATNTGSTAAANTGSTVASSTGSTVASIMASIDASIDSSTDSTPTMSTPSASTSPVSTLPDPLKNKFGMYHGCSYKGYEFRAEIKSKEQHTEVTYTVKEDLDTIVRYFIFSNIVVFIVN